MSRNSLFFCRLGLTTRSSSTTRPSVWCREVDAWAPFASSSPYRLVCATHHTPNQRTSFTSQNPSSTSPCCGGGCFFFPPFFFCLHALLSAIQRGWGSLGKYLGNTVRTGQHLNRNVITFVRFCANVASSQIWSHPHSHWCTDKLTV